MQRVAPETGVEASAGQAGERLVYLDNLKTLLIAGIIAAHAIMGYATFGSWTYQDVKEVSVSPVTEVILAVAVVSLGGLFLMALFFLISGLLTQDSLTRKGPSRFVSDRLLRLGVPYAVYTLLLWPFLEYALLAPILHRGRYWDNDPMLDNGPMWFVGVLLLFSLGLVVWRQVRPRPSPSNEPLRGGLLVVLAIILGVSTFVVRIFFFVDSNQIANLKLWAWPEYIVMFGLGVVAAGRGWLRPVPRAIARRCGIAMAAAIVVLAVAVLTADPLGLSENAYYGGWRLTGLLAALTEGVIAVAAPIWVLSFAQRHLNGTGGLRQAMARSSYGAFILQGPVLIGLALLLRPIDLSGDVKALLVATVGIAASFALAWPLVTRTPLRRML